MERAAHKKMTRDLAEKTKVVFDNRENSEDINLTAIFIGLSAFLTVTALVFLVE